MGPQGDHSGGERDARTDGLPPEVRVVEAAERSSHRRMSAHDDSDRRAD